MGFSERYQKNEELPEGEYLLVSVSAISDNREYDCIWEPDPITLAAGTVCVVQIEVEPGGIMRFPEALETATPARLLRKERMTGYLFPKQQSWNRRKNWRQVSPRKERMRKVRGRKRCLPFWGFWIWRMYRVVYMAAKTEEVIM